jgi:hypothetical protein
MAESRQLVEKITDGSFQLELITTGGVSPAAVAAQASDTHDSEILIHYWFAGSDGHVLDAPELVLSHDLQERNLRSAKFARSSHTKLSTITYQLSKQVVNRKIQNSVGHRTFGVDRRVYCGRSIRVNRDDTVKALHGSSGASFRVWT